jgi:hypothetical protein
MVLARLSAELSEHSSPETHAAVIELTTGIHAEVADAVAQLARLRADLARALHAMALRAMSAGTHPLVSSGESRASRSGRYRMVADSMRALARREPTLALHVHVGVPDPEDAIRVLNGLRSAVPLLLALSANSPFCQGRDTAEIKGQTDTEVLFNLALTFGLEDDPPDAVAQAIGLVEACGHERGVKYPFQGTIATSDGERLWAFRYSSEGQSRSLFFSRDAGTLEALYPERENLQGLSDEARIVVSEPIGDLPGAWNEVPEGTYGVAGGGDDQLRPFKVKPPAAAVPVTA